jgi:hypothetical protein
LREKAVGQGLFLRTPEKAERFCFLSFALQVGVVTQLSWIDFLHTDTLVELRSDRKMNYCTRNTIGQGLFLHKAATAKWFRIPFIALQARVVTQLSWINFMHPDMLVEFRRDGKRNCTRNTNGQGLFRSNSEKAERFRFLSFALQAGVMTQFSWIDFIQTDTSI